MKRFEIIMVPDNPLMPSTYPPRVIVDGENEEQVLVWIKEAKEQGQYVGHHLYAVSEL